MIERDGGIADDAAAQIRRLLVINTADDVVLFLIVANMVLKPTGADVGVLAAMGAVLATAVGYVIVRLHALPSVDAAPTGGTGNPPRAFLTPAAPAGRGRGLPSEPVPYTAVLVCRR